MTVSVGEACVHREERCKAFELQFLGVRDVVYLRSTGQCAAW